MNIARGFALLLGTLAVSLLVADPAAAMLKKGSRLFAINLGYSSAESDESSQRIDGAGVNFVFEEIGHGGRASAAFVVGYSNMTEAYTGLSGDTRAGISVLPITLVGKYYLLGTPNKGRFFGYGALGLGVHFSWRTLNIEGEDVASENSSGAAFKPAIGATAFISDTWYLNAEYGLGFLGNAFYETNPFQQITVGLGWVVRR